MTQHEFHDRSEPSARAKTKRIREQQAKALLSAADAAVAWWRGLKPRGWGIRKHLDNPTVNCTTYREKLLARRAARWYAIQKGIDV